MRRDQRRGGVKDERPESEVDEELPRPSGFRLSSGRRRGRRRDLGGRVGQGGLGGRIQARRRTAGGGGCGGTNDDDGFGRDRSGVPDRRRDDDGSSGAGCKGERRFRGQSGR